MKPLYLFFSFVLPVCALAQPSRETVLATEAALRTQAARTSASAAFQTHAAPSALTVEDGRLVPVSDFWSQTATSRHMTEQAIFADVSQSGDLAYTTGPRTWNQTGLPTTHEDFVTVWRRPANSSQPWQYVFDTHVAHGATTGLVPTIAERPNLPAAAALPAPGPVQVLLNLDEKFNQAALHLPDATYEHSLSAEARLYRPGQLALAGAALQAISPTSGRPYLFVAGGGYMSAACDLGYVYGSLRRPGATTNSPDEQGTYLRVWRREGVAGWRIVLEVLNPTSGQEEAPDVLTAANK